MTIDGNIKTFELSKALSKNGASATATSGSSSADNVLDFNKITRYQSVGSDDSTTETLIVTFSEPVDITRLLILNHNWKEYTITPVTSGNIEDNFGEDIDDSDSLAIEDDGGTLEFQDVISVNSSVETEGISENDYSLSSSYYEFRSMYCSGLTITIEQAQEINDEGDQEKYAFMVIPTTETNSNAGTFEAFPTLGDLRDFQSINNRLVNGRYKVEKQLDVFTAAIAFKANPSTNDAVLFEHLRYRTESFLIWPNGGKSESYFRFDTLPYRLQDIYQVQVINAGMLTYLGGIYSNAQAAAMSLRETI